MTVIDTSAAATTDAAEPAPPPPAGKGLKANSLGYVSNLVIAVASTAPAYSLAATLGFVVAVAGVGVHAPAVLIVSFVPILCVSLAYRYFNVADPDAGTAFAWVTRTFGPQLGWINGWAMFLGGIIVMASLAEVASSYTFTLLGLHSFAHSTLALILGCVVWIALMTWICYRGIEVSARVQLGLLAFEIVMLALFTVVALIKVYASHPTHSLHVQADWFNPFDLNFKALSAGMLLGVFIYWGWDAGVAVNEESRDRHHGPGRAAVLSTVILLLTYVSVSVAAQAFHGPGYLSGNSADVLNALGSSVFGSPLDKLLTLAVLTSAAASTQTAVLETSRTTLSMAHWKAIPAVFGRIHPRFFTPSAGTLFMGGLSIAWTVALLAFNPDQSVLGDTISALGFSVVFYYGLTGISSAVYFRRDLLKRPRNFLLAGLVPLSGGAMMAFVGIKAYAYYNTAGNNYSTPLAGIQTPIVVGIGGLILGAVLMLACWPLRPEYFRRRPERADPEVLAQAHAGTSDPRPDPPSEVADRNVR